eukprot:TRINITY_DN66488_c0_g1_i1.p1 TRINITY_DN66488_c0_g1~~TRINITY_DN66488_c0_g1_i1.p1  ORF type:complete len:410 (+),score=75.59 TRINITY_DN66488_c0_g1_i1:81-1310(+)
MTSFLALATLLMGACAQLQPGTTDVPSPRPGDCNATGPATFVYRLSSQQPNDFFPDVCKDMGGAEVRFNEPCAWAHGQAQMTMAHFTSMCKGASRTIHWHHFADEWGFVVKGRVETFVASPDGLPWPSSTNVLTPKGVWYFPAGFLHGLLCLTPESEGGCEFYIVFASPQAAEPNGHNLHTTLAQASDSVAAAALGMDVNKYKSLKPAFEKSAHSVHYSTSNMTAPIVTAVAPGMCDPECPKVQETMAAPAAVQATVEEMVVLPNAQGVVLHRIRTQQFPFARTMSQERTELEPGATRPMVWISADALLCVVNGSITVSLEGGMLGEESHLPFVNQTLQAGDIAYFPNGRAYWFQEATGTATAEAITVFNVGNWKSFEMQQSLHEMPAFVVASNLNVTSIAGASNLLMI